MRHQIHSILVSEDRQNCPRHCGERRGTREIQILLCDRAHLNSAPVIGQGRGEGRREGGRAVILCNEGWEHILVDGTF